MYLIHITQSFFFEKKFKLWVDIYLYKGCGNVHSKSKRNAISLKKDGPHNQIIQWCVTVHAFVIIWIVAKHEERLYYRLLLPCYYHNKPSIGFRPALKLLLRHICFTRAPPVGQGPVNLVFSMPTQSRRWSPTTSSSTRLGEASSSIRTTWPAEPLDTNTISNIIEELCAWFPGWHRCFC